MGAPAAGLCREHGAVASRGVLLGRPYTGKASAAVTCGLDRSKPRLRTGGDLARPQRLDSGSAH